MRALSFLFALGVLAAAASWAPAARAQVTDAERAAARELFKEGDELQRAGKFAEALDKFNRAQQVFSAPTNMLRIAECDAALGRLVESAEAYRAVVRTPLPPNSPPAFQAAVEQAKAELAQVEPRVPKLVVQVDPANAAGQQLQIDGQMVPVALIGEPFPLDPGTHRVMVYAPGFVSSEQSVLLKERDTRRVVVTLKPIAGVTYATGPAQPPPPPPPPPGDGTGAMPPGTPPPPPLVEGGGTEPLKKKSRIGLVAGLHLGLELPTGQIPLTNNGGATDIGNASASGFAYALDGGIRFARQWYVGLTLEHAGLGAGRDLSGFPSSSSNTTAAGAVLGLIVNPDRPSFFGEIGVQGRWYNISWHDPISNAPLSNSYSGAELLLGAGVWIPVGTAVRLLPLATVGIGTFNPPNEVATNTSQNNPGHAFFMLGLAGFYNADL
jgi:hypothetical protein